MSGASGDAGRPSREELELAVAELRAENAILRERVAELERGLGRGSSNSSAPPSSDPPLSRAERRRRAREAYKRSKRSTGGQPGHGGKTREMVAEERAMSGGRICRSVAAAGMSLTAASSEWAIRWSISSTSCRRSGRW